MATPGSLLFFGEPPPKKKRPEVPVFGKPTLSAGEYERRLKAGLPADSTQVPPSVLPQVARAFAAAGVAPPVDGDAAPVAAAAPAEPSPPAPEPQPLAAPDPASGGGGPRAAPTPTPRAPDVVGAAKPLAVEGDGALEPVDEGKPAAQAGGGGGFGGKRVYGFQGQTLEDSKAGAKKAIALRLEPLKPGLPDFERVLSEDRQSVTIGSKRGSVDLLVVDEAVSKRHCVLSLMAAHGDLALSIVDHSTNGTFVNGKRVPQKGKRFRIRSGDSFQVKDASLEEDVGWKCDFGSTVSFFTRS